MANRTFIQLHEGFGGARAFGSNVTAGSLLVIFVSTIGTATVPTVTDTLGNTYAQLGTAAGPNSDGVRVYCFRAYNSGAGANTITAATATIHSSFAYEMSGDVGESDPNDTSNSSVDDTSDPQTLSLTTSADGTIIFFHNNQQANNYSTPASGYTQGAVRGSVAHFSVYKLDATSGANSPGVDLTSGVANVAYAVAFKDPVVGGSTTRGAPFGSRGTAFNGGRTFMGILR